MPIPQKTIDKQVIASAREMDEKEQDYCVSSQGEIYFFLNAIMQEKLLISLHLAHSCCSIILSSILAIDLQKRQLIIDYGANEELNRIVLKRGHVRCTTNHNQIQIEFECNNLQHIQFEGHDAFRVDIPESLRRLQRRSFYRIATSITNPAICVISSLQSQAVATYHLLDISCSGMALIDQSGMDTSLAVGMTYQHCRIDLPGDEELFASIETAIRIISISSVVLDNGNTCLRISCEFLDLPEKSRGLIQRYIMRLEQHARKFDDRFNF